MVSKGIILLEKDPLFCRDNVCITSNNHDDKTIKIMHISPITN